jgi:hypothetical protein
MLNKELIQRVQSLYSKGLQSDDSRLSSRHIYNKIITVRSNLISQRINKHQKVSQWNYQTLPCVQLQKATYNECPCIVDTSCEVLRSVYKLPKAMVGLSSHLIQSVSSIDGSILFTEVTWEEKKYKKDNKYTNTKPDFLIRNDGYLYATLKKGTPLIISVTGLWEDPNEVYNFPSYCDNAEDSTDCTSMLDREFPIQYEQIDTLIEMAAVELLDRFSKGREDLSNDSKDSLHEESK